MFLILQIDTTEIARYYAAGGSNLLGLLLGSMAVALAVLATAIGALWWQGNRRADRLMALMQAQAQEYQRELVELNVSCVSTLNDLSANLEALRDAGVNMTGTLRVDIDNTRTHISGLVSNLAEKIRDAKK